MVWTPLAEPWRSALPGSKRASDLMPNNEPFRAWAEIDYSIPTGKVDFEKVDGLPILNDLSQNPCHG